MAQLYFYYAAMNAGKSTNLLQSAHNYREQGMDVLLYTAALDDRFGAGRIASRIGLDADAAVFDAETDFFTLTETALKSRNAEQPRLACLLIDEAQFLGREQVDQLARIVDELKLPVLCFGLRTDFRGELFAGSERLLAIADKLNELKAVCACGRKATMTLRLDGAGRVISDGSQVEIGGNERYVARCRRHWMESFRTGVPKP